VVSLTTSPSQKTHERNYSTDALPCALPFTDNPAPTAAHGVRAAVHLWSGDDVGTITLDRKRGQLPDVTTVDAHASGLGVAAVDGGAGAFTRPGWGVPVSRGRSGGEQSGQDDAWSRAVLFEFGTASHPRCIVFGTLIGGCQTTTVVSTAGRAASSGQSG